MAIFFKAPVWARCVKGAVRQRDDAGDPGEGDGGDHHQLPLLLRHQPEGPRHATGAVNTLAVKFTQKLMNFLLLDLILLFYFMIISAYDVYIEW